MGRVKGWGEERERRREGGRERVLFSLFRAWDVNKVCKWRCQWWRICLPMQETQVQSLVQEDPTWLGATKPVCYSYWAWARETENCNSRAHMLKLPKPQRPGARAAELNRPSWWEARLPQPDSHPTRLPSSPHSDTAPWRMLLSNWARGRGMVPWISWPRPVTVGCVGRRQRVEGWMGGRVWENAHRNNSFSKAVLGKRAEKWAIAREGCWMESTPSNNQPFENLFVC